MLIPKITIATCGCVPAAAKVEGKRVPLLAVLGVATSIGIVSIPASQGKDEQNFEFIAGDFEATNLQTGEVFQSSVLYLHSAFQELFAARLRRGETPLDIALKIYSVPASNIAGYSYIAETFVPDDGKSPVAQLKERLQLPQYFNDKLAITGATSREALKALEASAVSAAAIEAGEDVSIVPDDAA